MQVSRPVFADGERGSRTQFVEYQSFWVPGKYVFHRSRIIVIVHDSDYEYCLLSNAPPVLRPGVCCGGCDGGG